MVLKKILSRIKTIKYRRVPELPDWIYIPELYEFLYYRSRVVMTAVWLFAYYQRFFTVPGRLLFAASLLVIFYGTVLFLAPLLLLIFALVSLFLAEFIFGVLFHPKIAVKRWVPERVAAGSKVVIRYHLLNLRGLPACNLLLDPVHLKPGLRYFAGAASLAYLPARAEANLTTLLSVERRGRYELPRPDACSAFPFGIFKWHSRGYGRQKLLVYPRYTPLNILTLPTGKKYQRSGSNLAAGIGETMELLGCREFRVGDDPRHIHWPSTARAGKLIIKEFQEEYLNRTAIILDSCVPPKTWYRKLFYGDDYHLPLEAAVSLVAAVADYLVRGDQVLDLFVSGNAIHHFQSGRNLDNFDQLLDALACLQRNEINRVDALCPAIMEEIAGIGAAIVILLRWDDSGRKVLENLRGRGIGLKVIIVTDTEPVAAPDSAIIIKPGDIIEGKITVL